MATRSKTKTKLPFNNGNCLIGGGRSALELLKDAMALTSPSSPFCVDSFEDTASFPFKP